MKTPANEGLFRVCDLANVRATQFQMATVQRLTGSEQFGAKKKLWRLSSFYSKQRNGCENQTKGQKLIFLVLMLNCSKIYLSLSCNVLSQNRTSGRAGKHGKWLTTYPYV